MTTIARYLFSALICAALGFGQPFSPVTTVTDCGAHNCGTLLDTSSASIIVRTGPIVSGDVLVSNGTITTWRPENFERRTDDGHGITLAQLVAFAKPISSLAPAHYIETAKAVGLDSAALEEACIGEAVHDLALRVYPFDKVDDYLYRQALHQGTQVRWVWRPVRSKDHNRIVLDSSGGSTLVGIVDYDQYAHAIPERVLGTMKAILDKEPEALFLASDYMVPKPDPFLAVTTPKMLKAGRIFIVDRWDEPGYSEDTAVASDVIVRK